MVISVEYWLAPEHPDPAPIADCYAGLIWAASNSERLGYDPNRLILAGASAGGGIAAGTALKARDLGAPQLAGQLLLYPMLDDRNDTTSSRQVDGRGIWDRNSNALGWAALLNGRRGNESISGYAAPASAESLDNLPPTYLDCGSAEVFRDEITAYASRIWSHGGSAELHVWSGGFHAFDLLVPEARVSRAMVAARMDWLRRLG